MRIANSLIDLIGETPLVQLNRIAVPNGVEILVKLESMNPGGSSKDRPALTMIDAAERLSAGIDFVRVDLYDLGDRFLVGELTTTPQGGSGYFKPARWDMVFGARWTLPGWRVLRG